MNPYIKNGFILSIAISKSSKSFGFAIRKFFGNFSK